MKRFELTIPIPALLVDYPWEQRSVSFERFRLHTEFEISGTYWSTTVSLQLANQLLSCRVMISRYL